MIREIQSGRLTDEDFMGLDQVTDDVGCEVIAVEKTVPTKKRIELSTT